MGEKAHMETRRPTHRCKICGAFWIEYPAAWSLYSASCKPCCDNVPMGDQIEPIGELVNELVIELAYTKHNGLPDYEAAHRAIALIVRPPGQEGTSLDPMR